MKNTSDSDSRSPPESGSVVSRAQTDSHNDTAQPSLTSGFGAVIEKEHDLQGATERSLGRAGGRHVVELDRILRQQHSRLGANIALLEQRYQALPNPERFVSWALRHPPGTPRRTRTRDEIELLPDLIAQHTRLLADIEALIGSGPDGQRGELILTEVSRNHEEMAWRLTALLTEDATAARFANDDRQRASSGTRQAEEDWDNEGGGPASSNPPAS